MVKIVALFFLSSLPVETLSMWFSFCSCLLFRLSFHFHSYIKFMWKTDGAVWMEKEYTLSNKNMRTSVGSHHIQCYHKRLFISSLCSIVSLALVESWKKKVVKLSQMLITPVFCIDKFWRFLLQANLIFFWM